MMPTFFATYAIVHTIFGRERDREREVYEVMFAESADIGREMPANRGILIKILEINPTGFFLRFRSWESHFTGKCSNFFFSLSYERQAQQYGLICLTHHD